MVRPGAATAAWANPIASGSSGGFMNRWEGMGLSSPGPLGTLTTLEGLVEAVMVFSRHQQCLSPGLELDRGRQVHVEFAGQQGFGGADRPGRPGGQLAGQNRNLVHQ